MISVGLVTSSRADFGYYRPLLERIRDEPNITCRLIVTGAHLAAKYGNSVKEIEEAGYEIAARVASFTGDDTPSGIAQNMSRGVAAFADLFECWRPDLLIVFGDRHDMFPAVLAALPFRIPVAHVSGGEVTEGAIDNALRHSITMLSHLHFVSTETYRDRVLQMGEESQRVVISGSLAIDAMVSTEFMSKDELTETFDFDANKPFALATYHPVTLEADQTESHIRNLLAVVGTLGSKFGMSTLFTAPNPDTSSDLILSAVQRFCEDNDSGHLIMSAGSRGYISLMNEANLMIGNSSSGIAEAPSLGLPVVNIGTRQAGRIRAANVIDCGYEVREIMDAVDLAMSPEFKIRLADTVSPFGDGHAAERIIERILSIGSPDALLRKRFSAFAGRPSDMKGAG